MLNYFIITFLRMIENLCKCTNSIYITLIFVNYVLHHISHPLQEILPSVNWACDKQTIFATRKWVNKRYFIFITQSLLNHMLWLCNTSAKELLKHLENLENQKSLFYDLNENSKQFGCECCWFFFFIVNV